MLFRCLILFLLENFLFCVLYGQSKIHSNTKLLIVLKMLSKYSQSSLQIITGRKHITEQTKRNMKSSIVSFSNNLKQQILSLCEGKITRVQAASYLWFNFALMNVLCSVELNTKLQADLNTSFIE